MEQKLLVVDDEPVVRRLIRKLLQQAGYGVIEAADGDDALELIRREHPVLVLLDIHMPRLDGIATLDAILEIDPKVGVIMVTGDGQETRAKMAMDRGACDYLAKPFDADSLRTSVMAHLLARS